MNDKAGVLIDRREMLRVKIKSLTAEAKIIRREEKRTGGQLRGELHRHRIIDVRSESRISVLAYGFIKGRKLEQMEARSERAPNWKRVRELCKKYGPVNFEVPECAREKEIAPVA